VQALDGGQQVREQTEVRRNSPEAVVAREESRTKFENLTAEQATKLAGEAFPAVVDDPAGGPPSLPEGQRITGYAGPNVAQVDLGGGEGGVIESAVPMAVANSSGGWAPIDLGLREASGVFEPANPLVGVRVSKQLSEGVQIPGSGVSVAEVDGQGGPLSGVEGSLAGAVVLYANAQTDADTLVKPTTAGFEVDVLLRSIQSPQQFYFKVGLPGGASLVQATDGSGDVRVVKEGAVIASVRAPWAVDAAGTAVPVKMSVSGDTLVVGVEHRSGSYQYPIDVDPEFNTGTDSTLTSKTWQFESGTGGFTSGESERQMWISHSGSYAQGQWGELYYKTTGDSRLYEINAVTMYSPTAGNGSEFWLNAEASDFFEFAGSGGYENSVVVSGHSTESSGIHTRLYARPEDCTPAKGTEHNLVRLEEVATGPLNAELLQERLKSATVSISQPGGTHSTVSYSQAPELEDSEHHKFGNIFYTGGWLSEHTGAFEFTAKDLGLGVSETKFEYHGASGWELKKSNSYLGTSACRGVQCAEKQSEILTYANSGYLHLVNGYNTIRVAAHDAIAHTSSSEHGEGEAQIKVDTALPHGITLTGLASHGEEFELGEVEAHIRVEATDGEGSTPSSGIASIKLGVDGVEIGRPGGYCPEGPCTASNEWAFNGAELGAGAHILKVVATDNAGNVATKEYVLNVYQASAVAIGPGSVNPESGNFALNATDVDISGGLGGLAVTRDYNSRNLKAGAEEPLGPQWSVSLGNLAKLEVLPDGSVMVIGPEGLTHFSKKGSSFEAPAGDSNLKLEISGSEYLLKNPTKGTTTRFTLPSGATFWMPTVSEGPVATDTMTDTYKTVEVEGKKIVEPSLELAPHPSATCSSEHFEKGCRALEFTYSISTTASGESPSQWGEYNGRLMKVSFRAYNPATASVEAKPVAEYSYDKQGRLRAEWDPRISPALKTTYGYDSGGHVTVVSAPGLEPWIMHYGTVTGDASTGRLLSVTRPGASTPSELKEAEEKPAPVNTTLPIFSTATPVEGVEVSVSPGSWSNSPSAYSYQWLECDVSNEACEAIPGATNQTYNPIKHHEHYAWYLRAEVTATNADGSVVVETAKSGNVSPAIYFEAKKTFGKEGSGEGQFKKPSSMAYDSYDETLWVADTGNNRIEHFSKTGELLGVYGKEGTGNGEFKEPVGIAVGPQSRYNNVPWVYVSDAGNKRIQQFNGEGKYIGQFATTNTPAGIVVGSTEHYGVGCIDCDIVYVAEPSANRISSKTVVGNGQYFGGSTFGSAGSGNGQFSGPSALGLPGPQSSWLYVTDPGNHRIQILKVSQASLTMEYESQFGSSGEGNGQFANPSGIAFGPDGEGFFADTGDGRVQQLVGWPPTAPTFEGQYAETNVPSVVVGEVGREDDNMYTLNNSTDKVTEWVPVPPKSTIPPPPSLGTSAVTTIDYGVPLEGSEAPQQMGVNKETNKPEPEKWGQKDDPTYATAIFPPDEPMGWPAKDYKRASIYYLDGQARTVNLATPSGAISTREYNATNNVARSLSADNRAAALKEPTEAKSIEASNLLDTKSTYNGEGTQLLETRGPQHLVKLKSGAEVLARNHIKYSYDEGAPGGESYDLVTKSIDGAEYEGKEFEDARETTTSYSGQNNLGWTLRKPTSVTTDPNGLKLTHTTVYEASTGAVKETTSPVETSAYKYAFQFGSYGGATGQFATPKGLAFDSKGNFWVADDGNHRVEEFSGTGVYEHVIGSYGSEPGYLKDPKGVAVDSKGNIWIADTGNNRIQEFKENRELERYLGTLGTGASQFNEPKGIAVDSHNNVWVADTNNNRVEEFSESGEFKATLGFGVSNGEEKIEVCTSSCQAGRSGAGEGQFKEPHNIAFDAQGNMWVSDSGNNRLEEFNKENKYERKLGSEGSGNGQLKDPQGVTIDSKGNIWVADIVNNRIQEFNEKREYVTQFGIKGAGNGQFSEPRGIGLDAQGNVWVVDTNNDRVEKWVQDTTAAHTSRTIYYSLGANSEYPGCGGHIEWVELPCETTSVAQPGTAGLPELPTTTIVYNIWDEPEVTTETFGSTTRTKKATFDSAGRGLTTEVTSTIDQTVPKVTDEYNTANGALEKQSTKVGETTKTITSVCNTLGQTTSYTDADSTTTTYTYDVDGRVKEMSYPLPNSTTGKQTYTYDPTTGFLKELVDSAAGTFKATYDVAGKMLSESYPNNMSANYTHNQLGEATGLEYKKAAYCGTTCNWFSDTIVPSIHGETMKQSSTLSEEPSYTYDAAGRLTQVQEIPAGKGCTTRIYAYDEDNNRTSLTTRAPAAEGRCASEGGSEEPHTYDIANRLNDAGIEYEAFGNTTKLPIPDAGEHELTSKYYMDNQLYQQTQNGETIEYKLDPEGRTRETISTGNTASTVISHYAGPGNTLTWTKESTEKWTRNIPGIGGELAAIQTNGATPVLQLHDLQGNIVATAAKSETETKLLTTYNSTEFGVPTTTSPPKYSWLGADGVSSELPSGVISQGGSAYIPFTGRALQTEDAVLPLPVNAATPFVSTIESWVAETAGAGAAHAVTAAEEAQKSLEAANQPPPPLSLGDPAGCEEAGTCNGGGEEGGEGGGEGSCIGACLGARWTGPTLKYWGCSVSATIHFGYGPTGTYTGALGYFRCNFIAPTVEVQVCIQEEAFNHGGFFAVNCSSKGKVFHNSTHNGEPVGIGGICQLNHVYRAWVWGRIWGMFGNATEGEESALSEARVAQACAAGQL